MKVITVQVEDRDGNLVDSLETADAQAAEARIAHVRVHCPDAVIIRTEREV